MALFKFQATCPLCRHAAPRPNANHAPDYWPTVIRCEHCGAKIRPKTRPLYQLAAVGICVVNGALFSVHIMTRNDTAGIMLIAFLLFTFGWYVTQPYCTSFELVARGPTCPACEYDLYGSTSDTCPECGEDVRQIRAAATDLKS